MKSLYIFLFSFMITLCGCDHYHHEEAHHHDEEHDHHHEAEDHDHHGSNVVSMSAEQAQKIGVYTEVVKSQAFYSTIYTTAQVMPTNDAAWQVVAKSSGIVHFVDNKTIVGGRVEKGQMLMSIDNSTMIDDNIQVRKQEALAAYDAAKADYECKQELLKSQLVTKSDAEQAKQAFLSAKARYDNLFSNTTSKGTSVLSPAAGYIRDLNIGNGQYVSAGQTLATITKGSRYMLQALVPQQYYRDLRNVVGASFEDPSTKIWHDIDEYQGRLLSYSQSIASHGGMLPVTFAIDNSADLLDGGFVKMYIRVAGEHDCIAVPNDGVVEEMGAYFVFVQLDEDCYEKRPVTLGATDGMRTEIVDGLHEGEKVVAGRAVMLKLSQSAGAMDPHAGHVH